MSELPEPVVRPGHVLIGNAFSVISAGTEKMLMELARKSLLGKAMKRPEQVRRILVKLRNEGIFNTVAQVRDRLDEPMPLGYSSAGITLACGSGVQEFKPGDRVASNGPHAGVVCVPKHLCARVPDGVSLAHAAFTVLGAIALQGVRLAQVGLGEMAFVIGLGLIGQITVSLLKTQGCYVLGTDPDPAKCELAKTTGAYLARPGLNAREVIESTNGLGADAVLITASTKSDGPVEIAGEAVRKKGRVVAVGAVGLNLPRRPYYFKEAEFIVSCSYGPGRYDPDYEERGHDYPPAYVRWTEQRNMQAVLDLMASGHLDLFPLISHRFPIEDAQAAYDLIEKGSESCLGILLEYPESKAPAPSRIELNALKQPCHGRFGTGIIGAGHFARAVMLPLIKKNKFLTPHILCSAGGLSALHSGEKFGFEIVTTNEDEVFNDSAVGAVFIATPHDQHARQVIKALEAGKHVFVEKPLCISVEELFEIEKALLATCSSPGIHPSTCNPESAICNRLLMVGFNRRFSPATKLVKDFFSSVPSPLTISIRFNAGAIAADHWTQNEGIGGGRIVGEACHAIDLATYLTASPPTRVFAESIGGPNAPAITDDQCFVTLRHANGSVSNIAYWAGGDKSFPKERIEVAGGGRIAVIEDFRRVVTSTNGKIKKSRFATQQKGHREEIEIFAKALADGGPSPISWEEIYAVTLASILAVRSIREGIPFEIVPPQTPSPALNLESPER